MTACGSVATAAIAGCIGGNDGDGDDDSSGSSELTVQSNKECTVSGEGTDVSQLTLSIDDTATDIPETEADVMLDIDWAFEIGKAGTGIVSLEPDDGHKYVAVQWRVDVNGNGEFDFSSNSISLETDSAIYDNIFNVTGTPDQTFILPVSDVKVQFVFEIPDSVTSATLITNQDAYFDTEIATQFNCTSDVDIETD